MACQVECYLATFILAFFDISFVIQSLCRRRRLLAPQLPRGQQHGARRLAASERMQQAAASDSCRLQLKNCVAYMQPISSPRLYLSDLHSTSLSTHMQLSSCIYPSCYSSLFPLIIIVYRMRPSCSLCRLFSIAFLAAL